MVDVAPRTLTLRTNLGLFFGRKQIGNNNTVFKEISIVPPGKIRSRQVKSLLNAKIQRENVGIDRFTRIMFDAMKKAILEKWQPDKFHIVQHSSGWDSRMISSAIVSLAKEKDPSWLGNILFVELSGEHNPFIEIMKAQGWSTSQYVVYNPGVNPQEKHHRSFEFANAWKKLNGYCAYPVNCNWDAFEWLHELGIIPDSQECQILTGYGANEIGNWVQTEKGLKEYAQFIYYHSLSHFPLWGGHSVWIHPFYHLDYIKSFIKYGKGINPFYRKLVVERFGKPWSRIKDIPKNQKKKLGYRTITQEMQKQCQFDYDNSWLASIYPTIKIKRDINYHACWGYWSLASFCDYLIENGHTINA